MPRQSTKAKQTVFLKRFAKYGDQKQACAGLRLQVATVKVWLRTDADFAEEYQKTLVAYYQGDRAQLQSYCYSKLIGLLVGTVSVKKTVVKKKYAGAEFSVDESGTMIPNSPIETEVHEEISIPQTPRWVYERILGNNSTVFDAIATLIDAGVYEQSTIDSINRLMQETAIEAQQVLQNNLKNNNNSSPS